MRIWNIETEACTFTIKIKENAIKLEWSYGDMNLLCIGCINGIISWNIIYDNYY